MVEQVTSYQDEIVRCLGRRSVPSQQRILAVSMDLSFHGLARMGSWGLGTFDDDIACDWLEDLQDSDPIAFIADCLDLSELQYVEFLACVGVVCTAEIIHSLICEPRIGLPEAALEWLGEHQELNVLRFIPDAIAGLRRVMGPDSEMRELWEDSDGMHDAWMIQMSDLLKRLESALASNR